MASTTCLSATVPAKLCRPGVAPGDCFRATQPARCLRPVAHRQHKRAKSLVVVTQAARKASSVQAVSVGNQYSKIFDTDEAQADLRFAELLDGQNKILVISDIAPGSKAEKEGLQIGQQVLAVSDPVNEGQMLSLKSKPSKMALVRAMNMRNYPEVEMEFSSDVSSVAAQIIEKAGGKDLRKALEAAEVKTDAQESTSAIRNERKGEYMSSQFESKESSSTKASANKNKNQFAIIAGVGFFVVPLAFIAVAILSGYLQSLGGPGQQLQ